MRYLPIFLLLLIAALLCTGCTVIESPPAVPTASPPPPTPTSTPNPTATPTLSASIEAPAQEAACPPADPPIPGWQVYCNDRYGFYIQYPPDAVLTESDFNAVRIDLPVAPGTNLGEKYMELIVQETSSACSSPLAEGYPQEMVDRRNLVIQGKNFLRQSGSDAGAGNYYDWIAYSTGRSGLCVYLDFVLHSTNPFNYPTPPPEFDFDAEAAVFEEIAGSLKWYTP